jgi:hypothetical protein
MTKQSLEKNEIALLSLAMTCKVGRGKFHDRSNLTQMSFWRAESKERFLILLGMTPEGKACLL